MKTKMFQLRKWCTVRKKLRIAIIEIYVFDVKLFVKTSYTFK